MRKTSLSLILLASIAVVVSRAQAPAGSPAKRALIIGNSAYRNLPPVTATARNAEALGETLAALGFAPVVRNDLDLAGMLSETAKFAADLHKGDTVFFYFSGYGIQVDGANWLLPVNFDPKDNRELFRKAYAIGRLTDELEDRQAGARIVVIDASRDCPDVLPRTGQGLANMDPISHTLLAFSARPGETLRGEEEGKVNLFTQALIESLKAPGLHPNQVFQTLLRDVEVRSEGKQKPYYIPLDSPEFYFVPPSASPVANGISKPKPGSVRENSRDLLDYVLIPSGTFLMGCVAGDQDCAPEEKPQHTVAISKPFWMTRTEVTVSAYERFATAKGLTMPSPTKTNPKWRFTDRPISKVSWADAAAYCEWAGGRLPSEAEWEYAARGGKANEIYPWGNEFNPRLANSMKRTETNERFPETVPVHRYPENGFNLFDMAGNVREWTMDVWVPNAYSKPGPFVDPLEQGAGPQRVVRGGSFGGGPKDLRVSIRDHPDAAKETTNQTGFRCALPESALTESK